MAFKQRDRDKYRMIKLVSDAKEFFEKGQIGESSSRTSPFSYTLQISQNRGCLSIDKPTVIGQIVEELDRDGNEDGNGDRNGQGGVSEVADLTQGHPRDDEDSLWDDLVASIDEVHAIVQLRNKCNSFPSLEGKYIDIISNSTPPAVQTDRVTKTATRFDKGKGITIETEHIDKGKGLMFSNVRTDIDDDRIEDDFSSDYKEDDGVYDGSVNDEADSYYSIVDEDELFEDNSEDEIDRYESMYTGGTMWEVEGDGETQYNPAVSAAWIAKKLYEDVRAYPSMAGIIAAIESMFPRACRRFVWFLLKELCESLLGPKLKALMMRASNAQDGHGSST
ncbi:hypothetical protein Cgig2_033133 [Carnegiea gigantea]|uniref:Uncharacterized protein n=1 Tax=Carnegiea gigantea TaxID=171969 RepID=A0A9Q1JIJ0_9CARY|nr:hypothetical protein Cgig2_033133 [Carnegiea gigantea]